MALSGPVKPRRYINYTSAAPNPDSQTSSALHEIVTCPKTGRMWIQQSAVSPWSWQQFLPYVAANGTNPTTGVQIVNSSGNMVIQRPDGMTGGSLNAFGALTVDPSNAALPLQSNGSVFADISKNLRTETFSRWVPSTDVTISSANTLNTLVGSTFNPSEDGRYRILFCATFSHNNSFTASIGIRLYTSASVNYFLNSASGSAQGNNAWVSISCAAITDVAPSANQSVRFCVQSDSANVLVKKKSQANFPFAGVPSDIDSATCVYIERIG